MFQRLLLGPGHLVLVGSDVPNRQEDAGGKVLGPLLACAPRWDGPIPRKTQARFPGDGLLQVEGLKTEIGLADVVAVQLLLEAAVHGPGGGEHRVLTGLRSP